MFDRLPLSPGRWVAVGRLDLNSSGLLLFTDSGELANRLMHPRYELEREYAVRVQGGLGAEAMRRLLAGVDSRTAWPSSTHLEPLAAKTATGTNRWYRVVLVEGRNREVRRLFEAVGAQGQPPDASALRPGRSCRSTCPPGRWLRTAFREPSRRLSELRKAVKLQVVSDADGLRPIFCLSARKA